MREHESLPTHAVRDITFRWVVGIAIGLVLAIGGYTYRGLDAQVDANEERLNNARERVTAVETTNADVLRRLERIETKLDTLLERPRR